MVRKACLLRCGGGCRGFTLVELQVGLLVSCVLVLGMCVTVVQATHDSARQCLTDQALCNDMHLTLHGFSCKVRSGLQTDARMFAIYSSRANLQPVPDGVGGGCLYIPYSNPVNDLLIYASNGTLVAEYMGQFGPDGKNKKETLVSKGVTAASFSAEMTGDPLVRTGSVASSVTVKSHGGTVTLTSIALPRDR